MGRTTGYQWLRGWFMMITLFFFFFLSFLFVCYLIFTITASNSVMYRYRDCSSPRSNQKQNLPPNPSLTCQIRVLLAALAQGQVHVHAVPFSISPSECPSWDCRRLEARLLGLDSGLERRTMKDPSRCLGRGAGEA